MNKKIYPTDLTDNQWQVIEKLENGKVRRCKHSLRSIVDAIFYLVKTGCQWHMLSSKFAPWNTVYYYYRKWKRDGLIEELHEMLHDFTYFKAGRSVNPSLG
jgi:putative transposase